MATKKLTAAQKAEKAIKGDKAKTVKTKTPSPAKKAKKAKEPKEKKRSIRIALTEHTVEQRKTDDEIIAAVVKEFPSAKLSRTDVKNNRNALNDGDREHLGFKKPAKPYERLYRVGKELMPESKAPDEVVRRRKGEGSQRLIRQHKTKETLSKYGVTTKKKERKPGAGRPKAPAKEAKVVKPAPKTAAPKPAPKKAAMPAPKPKAEPLTKEDLEELAATKERQAAEKAAKKEVPVAA